MAKSSNLREFQESILLKLKEAASHGSTAASSRLGVTVGANNVLINLKDVTEVLPVPPLQPVPLTQAWFLGVANVRGNLYNVTDLAQFMGMPPTPKSANNRIILINSETTTQAAVLVENLIGLRSIDVMALKPSASDEILAFSKLVYEDSDNKTWLEFDIVDLVKDKAFNQPAI